MAWLPKPSIFKVKNYPLCLHIFSGTSKVPNWRRLIFGRSHEIRASISPGSYIPPRFGLGSFFFFQNNLRSKGVCLTTKLEYALCLIWFTRKRTIWTDPHSEEGFFRIFCGFVQSVILNFFQLNIMKNNLTFRYLLKKVARSSKSFTKKKKHSAARFQNHTKGRNPLIIEKNL